MNSPDKLIGDILISGHLITSNQLQKPPEVQVSSI
jgi:hypothetical protein